MSAQVGAFSARRLGRAQGERGGAGARRNHGNIPARPKPWSEPSVSRANPPRHWPGRQVGSPTSARPGLERSWCRFASIAFLSANAKWLAGARSTDRSDEDVGPDVATAYRPRWRHLQPSTSGRRTGSLPSSMVETMATKAQMFRTQQQREAKPPKPKKLRRPRKDVPVDTSKPGVSATDRRVGYGNTASRNMSARARKKGGARLENSATGKPSRKSTRRSEGRLKRSVNLQRKAVRDAHSAKTSATKARR